MKEDRWGSYFQPHTWYRIDIILPPFFSTNTTSKLCTIVSLKNWSLHLQQIRVKRYRHTSPLLPCNFGNTKSNLQNIKMHYKLNLTSRTLLVLGINHTKAFNTSCEGQGGHNVDITNTIRSNIRSSLFFASKLYCFFQRNVGSYKLYSSRISFFRV